MKIINNYIFRFFNGINEVIANRKKLLLFLSMLIVVCLLKWLKIIYFIIFPSNIVHEALYVVVEFIFIVLFIVALGTPIGNKKISQGFYRIGFYNRITEIPKLLSKRHISKGTDIIIYTFKSPYLSLTDWKKAKERIETILGYDIMKIDYGKSSTIVKLYCCDLTKFFSETIPWNDNYLVSDDSTIVLGISAFEKVSINLNSLPHTLIGGTTSSGKSTLLKLFLLQCIIKNMNVIVADFKGGIDFNNKIWHEKCKIITTENEFLDILISVNKELKRRTEILVSNGCRDINEYNNKHTEKLNRIIVACDEVAEILDKSGIKKSTNKEKLETIESIEQHIMRIARIARACGIHLILATQRPSSEVISGQIKSNLGNRVCGMADDILSKIVLDNTSAAEIPSDYKGVFITQSGELFKAYYFDDKKE